MIDYYSIYYHDLLCPVEYHIPWKNTMEYVCPMEYHIPLKTALYQPYVMESHVPVTTNQNFLSCSRHRDDPVNAQTAESHLNWLPSGYDSQFAMENQHPFLKFGKPSISIRAIEKPWPCNLNNQMVVWNSWNQLTGALEMGKLSIMTMNNHPIHPFPLGHPAAAKAPALSMQTLRVLGSRIWLQWAALANSLFMFSVLMIVSYFFSLEMGAKSHVISESAQ